MVDRYVVRQTVEMSSPYPDTYWSARDAFRQKAAVVGAVLETHPIAGAPGQPDSLSIDVAILGSSNPNRSIVISSGLHGVEGFFGSAVQTAFLQRANVRHLLDRRIQIVLIHAINPYGFAMLRRVNEDNIDLNRNFLLDTERYEGAPSDYRQLNAFLNPGRIVTASDFYYPKILWYILRLGLPRLRQAVGGGQYEFPKGLFFGGAKPSQSNKIIRRHIRAWVRSRQVLHLDFHTGLGRYGRCTLMTTTNPDAETINGYSALFETQVERADASDTAYRTRGDIGQCIQSILGSAFSYQYLAAEFGTYSSVRVLKALRNENAVHFFGRSNDRRGNRVRAALFECFCPRSSKWREGALAGGVKLIEQAAAF